MLLSSNLAELFPAEPSCIPAAEDVHLSAAALQVPAAAGPTAVCQVES